MNTWHRWCCLEIAIPYTSTLDNDITKHNQEQWIDNFIQAGITTLIVQDTTLEHLQSRHKLKFSAGDDPTNGLNQEQIYLTESSSVIQLNQPSLNEANYYEQMLMAAFKDKIRKIELSNGDPTYIIRGTSRQIATQPLGIDWTEIHYLQSRFPVEIAVQYTSTATYLDETFMKRQFEMLNALNIHHLVFQGDQTVGYPLNTKWMADQMKTYGMYFNFDNSQQGAKQLAKQSGYQLIRAITVDPLQLQYLPVNRAAIQLARDVTNGAIQMINLPISITDMEQDTLGMMHLTKMVERTLDALAPHYAAGPAVPMASLDVNGRFTALHRIAAMFGITLLTMITAYKLIRTSSSHWFVFLLSLTCFSAWLMNSSYTIWIENGYALIGAVAAPTLGIILAMERLERLSLQDQYTNRMSNPLHRFTQVVLAYLLSGLVTTIGAVFIISFWYDLNYWTEVVMFRGTRLQLIAPILLVGIYIWAHRLQQQSYSMEHRMRRTSKWWTRSSIIITVFGGTIFVLLPIHHVLSQTLHDDLGRIWEGSGLNAYLRPNEWLVGHPLFIIATYRFLTNKSQRALFIPAVIGQISMMNAFMHIYTPLLSSINQSLIGIVVGCVIGLIIHGMQHLIRYATVRLSHHRNRRESHTSS